MSISREGKRRGSVSSVCSVDSEQNPDSPFIEITEALGACVCVCLCAHIHAHVCVLYFSICGCSAHTHTHTFVCENKCELCKYWHIPTAVRKVTRQRDFSQVESLNLLFRRSNAKKVGEIKGLDMLGNLKMVGSVNSVCRAMPRK
jgi:hypothetical protein